MKLEQLDNETIEDVITQPRNGAKHHKREINGRPGRLEAAEKRYRKHRTHTGKTSTLRSHRP